MAESCLSTNSYSECKQFLSQLITEPASWSKCSTYEKSWSKEQLHSGIIDFLIRFLRDEKCPVVLLAPLTSCTKKKFFGLDLEGCKIPESDDYDPAALCKLAHETLHDLCVQGENDLDIFSVKEIKQQCSVFVHSIKNARRKMEDEYTYYEDINTLFDFDHLTCGQSLFGVFDGHGGAAASNFSAIQLIWELHLCQNLLTDPGEALKTAILKVDEKFCEKAKRENCKSGSTAIVVLIQGDNLTVAWVGDSQAVLCKDGQAIQVMEPHKPEDEEEKCRIEALGGLVLYCNGWRVNGSLSVSRAIGDIEHKPYITAEAAYEEYSMDGDEEFLIIACDGLWDVVDPLEGVECVQECVRNGTRDKAAEQLVDLAKEKNSLDNITVMVVYLDFNNNNCGNEPVSES